jgi:hypothetical protein
MSRWIPRIPAQGGGGQGPPGPPGPDHFKPKYLVGNIPAGDDPVAYNVNGFMYIPDPGDGSGIAIALTQPNGPGDVGIRPGLFDYNAGVVVAPLVIPAGVTVWGSGETTVVRGRFSGDQGVFVLNSGPAFGPFATLRDIVVESAVGEVPGPGLSTSVIRCVNACTLEDVGVSFRTNAASLLRNAISFETSFGSPLPPSRLTNVRIGIFATGQEVSPVVGLRGFSGQNGGPSILGQTVEIYDATGGNGYAHGILSEGCTFIINMLVMFGFNVAGARSISAGGGGAIRIDEGVAIAGTSSTAATIGFHLDGGGHILRSVDIQSQVLADAGVRLSANPNSVEIEDVSIGNFRIGIDIGGGLGSNAIDVTVADSTISVPSLGIRISGSNSQNCHLDGNVININFDGANPQVAGIHLDRGGAFHDCSGNVVNVQGDPQNPAPGVHGIWCQAQLSTVRANKVSASNVGYGIEVDAERVVTTSNVCTSADGLGCIHIAPLGDFGPRVRCVTDDNSCTLNSTVDPAPLPACIVYEGASGTINGNACFMGTPTPPHAGIVLTAASSGSICIGNVVDGAAGLPVINLGVGNETAHNIGN